MWQGITEAKPSPSSAICREREGKGWEGRKKGEESKREGGEKGFEENPGEKGGICLKGYCLVCVRCFGFFFRQCSLCWDLGCFVLSAVWSLSSLMSLNSQGHSNLAQDSAFCRVALTDAWDVFVTLLDISSAGFAGYRSLGVKSRTCVWISIFSFCFNGTALCVLKVFQDSQCIHTIYTS